MSSELLAGADGVDMNCRLQRFVEKEPAAQVPESVGSRAGQRGRIFRLKHPAENDSRSRSTAASPLEGLNADIGNYSSNSSSWNVGEYGLKFTSFLLRKTR